jgi:AraC-like DNA-binding protein
VLRASQLGSVSFRFFRVNPDRLTGLVTWGEQQVLERAATQEVFATRAFAPDAAVAHSFKVVCGQLNGRSLPLRVKLLNLFLQALAEEIWPLQTSPDPMPDARIRLIKLLNETPASELLELSFGDLVRQVRCTPRHLSRIFHQLVGVSFREKQAHLRLLRAQELLATSQSKILEVALESGYQSLSLFNVMFKRRFGLTPAKWRDHTRQRLPTPSLERRLRA